MTSEAAERCQGGSDDGSNTPRAVLVERRSDALELDQLHGNRWISDVAWLRFGKRHQRQRRACGLQALPFSN